VSDRDLSLARIKPGYVLLPEQITQPELTEEDQTDFAEGVRLFNEGAFWESHEAWEQVWKRHTEPSRVFFQALIQTAAAYHQLKRGIYHGTVKHFRNAGTKLEPFPSPFLGIDVDRLRLDIRFGETEALRLGVDGLADFDPDRIAKL